MQQQGSAQVPPAEVRAEHEWRFAPGCGDHAQVYFCDGRPFYNLTLIDGSASFTHYCHPDTYSGTLEVTGVQETPTLKLEWRIAGPKKDSTILTTLVKQKA